MSLFDDPTKVMPLQRAVVAFSSMTTDVTILWCTRFLRDEIEHSQLLSSDVFEQGHGDNPSQGIWVWEGRIVVHTDPATPDHPTEYSDEYVGGWRAPDAKEWARIRVGKNPFEEARDFGEPTATPEEEIRGIHAILRNLWHEVDLLRARLGQIDAAQSLAGTETKVIELLWKEGDLADGCDQDTQEADPSRTRGQIP